MSDSSVRKMADPHLAAIRMVTQAMRTAPGPNSKIGSQLEGARFNLFTALEQEDYTAAADWLNTLEVGLGFLEAGDHPSAAGVARALEALREILDEETEEEPAAEETRAAP